MRRYAVRRAASVVRDFSLIKQHLIRSYEEFGDTHAMAAERAEAPIRAAFEYMQTFASHPHRGTIHTELEGCIRHVTNKQFVFYFQVDEQNSEIRILAVFFGSADHLNQIAGRLAH